mmetsp:Transcript_58277/g.162451  ORF Transcript_58277/g.162451 Transcript_58277/m.162451 type:complete len:171 (+) Transcript_58277:71-583(+)
MPPKHRENFSIGVTQLLDELLAKEDEAGQTPVSAPGCEEAPLAKEEIASAFQRTADLCGTLDAWSAKGRKDRFERELHETLGSTTGSLAEAISANEAKLAEVRAGILEELRRRSELADASPSCSEGGESELDMDALLAECDAIQAVASKWQGLRSTPPGWRRLDSQELRS